MSKADIVNEWYRTKLASGAIAQNTPAYNQLVGALPELIASLDAADAAAAPPVNPVPAKPSKGSTKGAAPQADAGGADAGAQPVEPAADPDAVTE